MLEGLRGAILHAAPSASDLVHGGLHAGRGRRRLEREAGAPPLPAATLDLPARRLTAEGQARRPGARRTRVPTANGRRRALAQAHAEGARGALHAPPTVRGALPAPRAGRRVTPAVR